MLDRLEARVRQRVADAPEAGEVSRLAPAEARALFPPLREGQGALHIAGAACVDGRAMSAGLAGGAARLGAVKRAGDTRLVVDGSRARGVEVGGELIEAHAVVVTAGAWAPALLRAVGVADPVQPQRGQIIHFELPGVDTSAWPVVLPMTSHYMLAFPSGRIVVGATRETGSGFDYRVTASGMLEVLHAALELAPGLAGATVLETRIGFRPAGMSIRPTLGEVPGVDGLFVGNGLWASGLTIGPYAGRLLAQVVLGAIPDIDPALYTLGGP